MRTDDVEQPDEDAREYEPTMPVQVTFPLHEARALILFAEHMSALIGPLVDEHGVNYTLSFYYALTRVLEGFTEACDLPEWRLYAAGLRAELDQLGAELLDN